MPGKVSTHTGRMCVPGKFSTRFGEEKNVGKNGRRNNRQAENQSKYCILLVCRISILCRHVDSSGRNARIKLGGEGNMRPHELNWLLLSRTIILATRVAFCLCFPTYEGVGVLVVRIMLTPGKGRDMQQAVLMLLSTC